MKTLTEKKKDFAEGRMIKISEISELLREMKEVKDKDLNRRDFKTIYSQLKEIGRV